MSPLEYGQYQITLSTFGLLRVFNATWLSASVTRLYLEFEKKNQENVFFSTLLICSIIGSICIACISICVNLFYLKSKIDAELFILLNVAIIASIFNALFEIFVVVFRANFKPKKYVLYWLLFSVGKPFIGIILIIFLKFKGEGIFWGFFIVSFILDLVIFKELKIYKHFEFKKISKELFKQFMSYGIPIAFSFLSFWILTLSDRYIIEWIMGSASVGIYSLGYTISEKTLNFMYTVLMLAAYPIIIDNWQCDGIKKTQHLITEITRIFFLLCVPILVVLIVIPQNMVRVFSTEDFLGSASILPFIAVGIFLYGLTQYVIKGFELRKKSYKIAILALMAGVINIVLNLLLIPKFGIYGAGYSAVLSYTVYFVSAIYFVRNDMAWIPPFRSLINIYIAAVIFGLFLKYFYVKFQNDAFMIIFNISSGFFIYLLILLLIKEIKVSDIQRGWIFFVGFIKRK
ncbi:polysaccharide biosynthesis C-terminal domain-containing protein [bacterium]|nr:polysaccharide biosynthesis C-terminal domain-containing protein [bacterium]